MMEKFLEIKCLSQEEQRKLFREIEKAIAGKKQAGILTDREIREIHEMKLKPLLDIQDVQNVLEDLMYRKK